MDRRTRAQNAVACDFLCEPQTVYGYMAEGCSYAKRRPYSVRREVCRCDGIGLQLADIKTAQKYYKLRNESIKLFEGKADSPSATPKKRKASNDNTEDRKKSPPTKRAREEQPLAPREAIDGVPFQDVRKAPREFKIEEMAANELDSFQSYNEHFAPVAFFPAVNMDGQMHGQMHGQASGSSSFMS